VAARLVVGEELVPFSTIQFLILVFFGRYFIVAALQDRQSKK
jgi:hypothetical protein